MRNYLFFTIALALSATTLAQSNSPYSRYGLGDFRQKGSVRGRMMGGTGIANQYKTDVNNVNPAALVAMDSSAVLFDVGFHVNRSTFSGEEKKQSVYSGNLDYVSLAIPMHKRWFFSAGVQPLSSVGYNINTQKAYNGKDPTSYYNVNYKGEGGMSLASMTNSFKLPWGLSLGAELGVLWGNHNETISETYAMDVSYTRRNTISYHRGFIANTGAQLAHSFDRIHLVLGLTYDIPTQITSEQELSITSSTSAIKDETIGRVKSQMPSGYGIGLSCSLDQKLTLSADYRLKKWSESAFGIEPQRLCDNNIFSMGGEFLPDYNSNQYLKRIAFRAGLHYETGSFKVLNSGVQSGYLSFGLGLPGRMNNTLISIGFELGTIGGFNNKHLSENYGQINIGLNLGEIWFMKAKFH